MRSFALLLSVVLFSGAHAQRTGEVSKRIRTLRDAGDSPVIVQLFSGVSRTGELDHLVAKATTVELDLSELERLRSIDPSFITITVPYNGDLLEVELIRTEIATTGVRITTDKGEEGSIDTGVHYRGNIVGDPSSLVACSFFQEQVVGLISSVDLGDLVVAELRGDNPTHRHVVYAENDLISAFPFTCGAKNNEHSASAQQDLGTGERSDQCIRMYYELTQNVYMDNGSDLAQTTNWITAVHNIIATVFANDGITLSLSEVFIWTTPTPFPMDDPANNVADFRSYRTAYNGDIAFCINTGGGAGAAYLAALCTQPYAASSITLAFEELPLYSFTISNIAHEIGHVLGSPHTHDCTWNGNNTQIDDCGNEQAWLPPGPCYDASNPIIPPLGEGTIMSYCPGALAAGFGVQPTQRMLVHMAAVGCIGTDCITSCTPSVDDLIAAQTSPTTALITWTSLDPSITEWEVRLYGQNMVLLVDWTTVYSPSYEAVGLIPEDWHRVDVRTQCPDPFSGSMTRSVEFFIPATHCGLVVQDSGGDEPYVYDCIFQPRTFHPYSSEHVLTLTFSEFDLEPDVDFLVIHDGATVDAPVLTMLTGNALPAPISASAPGGALTVIMVCDELEYTPYTGWIYTVSCDLSIPTSVKEPDPEPSTLLLYPDPVMDMLNIRFELADPGHVDISLFDMQGRLVERLMYGQLERSGMMVTSFDVAKLPAGTYLLRFSTQGAVTTARFVRS